VRTLFDVMRDIAGDMNHTLARALEDMQLGEDHEGKDAE
jgi:hypothetical protein